MATTGGRGLVFFYDGHDIFPLYIQWILKASIKVLYDKGEDCQAERAEVISSGLVQEYALLTSPLLRVGGVEHMLPSMSKGETLYQRSKGNECTGPENGKF